MRLRQVVTFAALLPSLYLAACHAHHVEITIENHTGAAVQLLEFDYPSASFGADTLAAGATFRYRIQVEGSGAITLSYTAPGGAEPHITGPSLSQNQQGSLGIVLLPGGKAEFHPQLTAGR